MMWTSASRFPIISPSHLREGFPPLFDVSAIQPVARSDGPSIFRVSWLLLVHMWRALRQVRHAETALAIPDGLRPISQWLFAKNAGNVLQLEHGGWAKSHHSANSEFVGSLGKSFHESAGTLTEPVIKSLNALKAGRQWTRIGHQPNFAAYLKLAGLFDAASEAALMSDTVPVYIVNDFDIMRNERFTRSILPDVTHPRGGRYLSLPINRGTSASKVSFRAERPSYTWLIGAMQLIQENYQHELRIMRSEEFYSVENIEGILADLRYAWEHAVTLSDMASIFLSRLINLRLHNPTVFIPGRKLWMAVGPSLSEDLVARWAEIARAQNVVAIRAAAMNIDFNASWMSNENLAPLWRICACGCRVRLEFGDEKVTLHGACDQCERQVSMSTAAISDETAEGRMVPRISALDLSEHLAHQIRTGVTYVSSAPHTIAYSLVAHELRIPVLPHILLDISGNFGTPIEKMTNWKKYPKSATGLHQAINWISSGRASLVYYLSRSDIPSLSKAIREWIRFGHIDDGLML